MKQTVFAVLLMISAGCGDDEAEPSLVGDWLVAGDGPYDCAYGLSFDEDGTYVEATICTLEEGSLGVEVYTGTYVANGEKLALKQTHGSCPEAEPGTLNLRYELAGDDLRLGNAEATVVMSRAEGGDVTGGVAVYGCYAQDGAFTPQPISEL
jgi:hypothetical protein